ncbi:CaiB/BaiF CoA transferase family protein [Pseudonocardia benzenivorans]|uniref:Formyl-CoA transferase n=2 Tax=Pseudonocardia TaxID=1847 RepID=F4CT56_PSEUX|nr:CaiB/BaiF CoA-transferase family protein [Pseudonocardia dioxanivorans]AEA26274.1 Formyl-CoA transferase [Pseudonocardia dioxanivorans CB1190]GJF03251.1 dehydratase [Pseudonocardia sp. D17]
MTPRPLDGVTVVTVEQAVAAPFATRQLADLGARVVKIERPGGGDFARGYDRTVNGTSSVFLWLNRGKESLSLDLKAAAGRDVLERLLAGADVFVQNLSPAAAARAGLDPAAVRARHPRVIACGVSGYGTGGPMRDAKAYDLLVQGETGIISINGDPAAMAKVGISIADISAGMYTYSAVLAALVHRDRTGEALPVEVSLFDSLAEWLAYPLYYTLYGGTAPARMGTTHPTIAPYGAFPTADGTPVLVAVQNDREWRRLCEVVLGDPARADDPLFATNHDRIAHRTALDSLVGARLAALPTAQAQALLDEAGIAQARINDIADLPTHPQLVERDRWVDTPTPTGPARTLYPPGLPGDGRAPLGAVPAVGEHTDAVLRGIGLSPDDIAALRADGVV